MERELTKATRASLDSSSIAAHASRKLLANAERCEKRMQLLDEAIACGCPRSILRQAALLDGEDDAWTF